MTPPEMQDPPMSAAKGQRRCGVCRRLLHVTSEDTCDEICRTAALRIAGGRLELARADDEQPTPGELWIVLDVHGALDVCETEQEAIETAAEFDTEDPELPCRVRRYVLAPEP